MLPEREKYSKIVGLWTTEAGQPNEACHIWAYPSLNARAEARGNAMKDPAWHKYLEANRQNGYVVAQRNSLMTPVSFARPHTWGSPISEA